MSDRGLEFSSLVPHRAPASAAGFTAFVDVETVSLDSWFAERRVDPALIKIDVEGAEDLVVGGMEQTLRTRPPRRIVCETVRGGPPTRGFARADTACSRSRRPMPRFAAISCTSGTESYSGC